MKPTLLSICLVLFFACKQKKEPNKPVTIDVTKIQIQQADSINNAEYFHVDSVSEVYPDIACFIHSNDPIAIPIGYDTNLNRQIRRTYCDPFLVNRTDTTTPFGIVPITNYNTEIMKYDRKGNLKVFYPLYLVNQTSSKKVILGKDGSIFAIQEAYDKKANRWRPIEGRGFDFCGEGYHGTWIQPTTALMVLIRKYSGDYTTQLRLRIKIGDNTFTTLPVKGKIKYSQFYLPKNGFLMQELLSEPIKTIKYYFHDGIPKDAMDSSFIALHAGYASYPMKNF